MSDARQLCEITELQDGILQYVHVHRMGCKKNYTKLAVTALTV